MDDFKTELLTLLEKHNASIHWGCASCSDLHGVTGEHMAVTNKKGDTLLLLDGGEINPYEIRNNE